MKKTVVILGFLISIILIGLGVYGLFLNKKESMPINKDDKNRLDVLKQSVETIKNINNFSWDVNVTTNKEEENSNAVSKMDLDTKQSEIAMSISGVLAMHSYTVLENEVLVNYISMPAFGVEGFVKTIETENNSFFNFDRTRFEVLSNNINLFEEKENNMFVATIPKEIAGSLIFSPTDDGQDEKMEVLEDIQIVVTLNNNNIDKVIYDYSNAIKSGEEVYTSYVITEKYYDIGSTVINVPDEVKNNAIQS